MKKNDAVKVCEKYIQRHRLPMKVLSAEEKDEGKITFYFRSPTRVDFRSLVKDLNQHFKGRVELRQVEGKHAAKKLGGIGRCGRRELCCKLWESRFPKVSVDNIKELGLEGNPNQYIGPCGRLMCCLAFDLKNFRFPQKGQDVDKEEKHKFYKQLCAQCGRNLNHTHIKLKEEPTPKEPPKKRIRRILK